MDSEIRLINRWCFQFLDSSNSLISLFTFENPLVGRGTLRGDAYALNPLQLHQQIEGLEQIMGGKILLKDSLR